MLRVLPRKMYKVHFCPLRKLHFKKEHWPEAKKTKSVSRLMRGGVCGKKKKLFFFFFFCFDVLLYGRVLPGRFFLT